MLLHCSVKNKALSSLLHQPFTLFHSNLTNLIHKLIFRSSNKVTAQTSVANMLAFAFARAGCRTNHMSLQYFDCLTLRLLFSWTTAWGIVVGTQSVWRRRHIIISLPATLHMLIREDRRDVFLEETVKSSASFISVRIWWGWDGGSSGGSKTFARESLWAHDSVTTPLLHYGSDQKTLRSWHHSEMLYW